MRKFQDEVRSALLLYAIVPVLLITVICLLLAAFYWHRNVAAHTEEEVRATGAIFTELTQDYEERAAEIAAVGLDGFHTDENGRSAAMERVYAQLNRYGAQPHFFLLDAGRHVLFSTERDVPPYLVSTSMHWGVLSRMEQQDGGVAEFVPNGAQDWDYVVGQAVHRAPAIGDAASTVDGYAVFVVPVRELGQHLQMGEKVHFAIADRAGRAPFVTMPALRDHAFQKIVPALDGRAGLVSVDGQHYYAASEPLDGGFTIYALLPLGSRIAQFATGVVILLGVFLLMLPLIVISVRRETRDKTRAVGEIVDAFRAVRHGHLDRRLAIRSDNEFEEIGAAYNRMAESLVRLMRENEEEARASVISELRQLESQFNPHFLFNTLENIKFMTKLAPDDAVRMISALSALLRYSIDNRVRQVTLAEDLCHLDRYIEIQRLRFGAHFSYRQEAAKGAEFCFVPKLLLQPVVENAIHYGADAEGNIEITSQITMEAEHLHIVIADRGMGMDAETLHRLRTMMAEGENRSVHTGLYNIDRRIRLLYGTGYGVHITCPPSGGTRVEMVLPIRCSGGEENAARADCRG